MIKPSRRKKSQQLLWEDYRKLFVNRNNIEKGKSFISNHDASLKKAYGIYGVPPSVIAAIIGVETRYGKNKGKFPVFDTLATLAFEKSGRQAFFREELEALILLSIEEKLPVTELTGSYAGAVGIPQFMPSSWKNYAIDFDQNGETNLITSSEDAIGSIANYLFEHGWEKNIPTHSQVTANVRSEPERYFTSDLRAEFRYKDLEKNGFKDPQDIISPNLRVSLIDLRLKNRKKIIWLATKNFFVITKYNRSYKYAAAVLELAEALEDASR